MKNYLLIVVLAAALSGCVSVAKVESGDRTVGERMVLTLDGAWNHINMPNSGPAQTWTMEGLAIDQLMIYSGLRDGELVHAESRNPGSGSQPKSFRFRAAMQPDEIVALFEGMFTRDGSQFALSKLEPAPFVGEQGFRFDYTLTRRIDNVVLSGFGYCAVNKSQLFAVIYQAPRLTFFTRQARRVDAIARSARVKG
jgi:hypothetical protein